LEKTPAAATQETPDVEKPGRRLKEEFTSLLYHSPLNILVTVVEWTVFALAATWAIGTNIALRQHYKNSNRPELLANSTALAQLMSVVVIAVAGYSPFHLVWLLPASYLTGIFVLRSRIASRVAWLYGYAVTYTIPSNW
jgi:hypothetical protein